MTISAAFLELMPSTVTIYTYASRDAYGKRTASATGTAVRCRIEPARKVTRDKDGREVVELGVIYLYGVSGLTVDDKVVLPDSTEVRISGVETSNDEDGTHHTVIRYGD